MNSELSTKSKFFETFVPLCVRVTHESCDSSVGVLLRGERIEIKLNPELGNSGDMGDWADANDLASEISHGTAFIDMMSPIPPGSPSERKFGTKSAPPLNLKNLPFRDSGSQHSKPSSPSVIYDEAVSPEGDANSYAGSAVNIMRKVKSSGRQ